jgi:hypothetical protein
MPSLWSGAVWRASVRSLAMLGASLVSACTPEYRTPAPPFRDLGSASAADLRSYCNDSALRFDEAGQKDTLADEATRVGLVAEEGSQAISEEDLVRGRVLAKIRVVKGSGFQDLGVRDSACWFAKGRLPDSVVSTFISFAGETLGTFATLTHAERERHRKAEVRWYPSYGKPEDRGSKRSELPVRLASLVRAAPLAAGALAWSTCTGGYCCSPIKKHE